MSYLFEEILTYDLVVIIFVPQLEDCNIHSAVGWSSPTFCIRRCTAVQLVPSETHTLSKPGTDFKGYIRTTFNKHS